jgi:hypothetical protein
MSVATANQAFACIALAMIGWTAARWTDRPRTAVFVIAAGALHPVLARVGASEDAHNVGVVLAAGSLLAIDIYAAERNRVALLVAAACLVLAIETRQTFILWPPCVLALALARGSLTLLKRAEFLVASAIVLAAFFLRLTEMVLHPGDQVTFVILPIIISIPGALLTTLRYHPLLDITRMAALTLPLAIIGFAALVPRMRRLWPFCALFALSFLSSLAMTLPTPGVEFSFRMPTVLLGLIFAGVGVETILSRWTSERARPRTVLVVGALTAALLAFSPLAMPGARTFREVSPQIDEYRMLRGVAASLGSRFTVAEIPTREPAPSYSFPRSALAHDGARTDYVPVDQLRDHHFVAGPVYFLQGLQCRGYSLVELARVDIHQPITRDAIAGLQKAMMNWRSLEDTRALSELRPECAAVMAHAKPRALAELTLPRSISDPPYVLYGDGPVHLRFVELLRAPPSPGGRSRH